MIEGARCHGYACARLLVERPEAQIIPLKVSQQRLYGPRKELARSRVPRGKKVVVDTPNCPDESVEYVSGRRDNIFLEPQIALFVGERDAAFVHRLEESS